ncbi:MAG: tRNA 4-thiouridine(8) synthase ThiI [Planctomycetes bacterium]|jgi:thiamine biosynthesis protein ThiI|nr:tRNA 4-thiouridine(8) synthase ThiI [Planctomycetota bacterium]MBT5120383.1 tRNA 4-thiouridine(8) synthase ThiI [Planctomycetota bacterium]
MESPRALLIRYAEIGLKGGNRPMFERALRENIKSALKAVPGLKIDNMRGRMLVRADIPAELLADRVSRVFGVASCSPAVRCGFDPTEIVELATEMALATLQSDFAGQSEIPFRVRVNRAEKRFPMRSLDLEKVIAESVLPAAGNLKVNLKHADFSIEVDIRQEGSWVFCQRIPGPGGLPVGTMGRGFCLLSGGIDSPVAAWEAMKRGIRVEFVSFYSFPHVGPQTREKIIRIATELAKWQPTTVLHIAPFAPYQEAIRRLCPEAYRTVLYRRAMQRIAGRIAGRRKGKAIITGESVGQVASQTLENMAVIQEASRLPVLRPLVTHDKQETITKARRIGTYDLSNLPAPDCCTVFQPESPIIYGKLADALEAEKAIDLDVLTYDAFKGVERIHISEES